MNGVPATETLYTGGGGRRSSKQAQWMGLTARIAAVVTLSAGRLLLGCDFTGDKPALVSIVRGGYHRDRDVLRHYVPDPTSWRAVTEPLGDPGIKIYLRLHVP